MKVSRAWWGAWVVILASSCPLYKRSDAIPADPDALSAILGVCSSSTSYVTNAAPAIEARCSSCHGAGGSGVSGFSILSGSSLSDAENAANLLASLDKLLDDDGGNYEANPLLSYPSGSGGHTIVFNDPADDLDYLGIRQWVEDERSSPCAF